MDTRTQNRSSARTYDEKRLVVISETSMTDLRYADSQVGSDRLPSFGYRNESDRDNEANSELGGLHSKSNIWH